MPLPPDLQPGDPIPAAWLNEVKRLIRETITGDGKTISTQESGGRLVIRQADPRGQVGTRRMFKVTAATKDGSNNRWVYTARRLVEKTAAGYAGAFTENPYDTANYTLYSLNEFNNAASGQYGNGVTQANLDSVNNSGGGTDGTFALVPIPEDTIVTASMIRLADGTPEWWIDPLPNGVDGVCPVPP